MSKIKGEFILRSEALTGNLIIRGFEMSNSGMILVRVFNELSGNIYLIDAQLLEVLEVGHV